MTCENARPVLVEIARAGVLEEAERRAALEHAAVCEGCAATLAREQELSGWLGREAEAARGIGAPERLEAALLEAFRGRRAEAPARVVPSRWRYGVWVAGGAAAAGVALALWLGGFGAGLGDPAGRSSSGVEIAGAGEAGLAPDALPEAASEEAAVEAPVHSRPAGRSRPARPSAEPAKRLAQAAPGPSRALEPPADVEQEAVTDFFALTYGDPLAHLDHGSLVRVELPPAALGDLGFATAGLAAYPRYRPVRADVLLGGDGVPRAIRFVSDRREQ